METNIDGIFVFGVIQRSPRSALFPYTTLFRSVGSPQQVIDRTLGFRDYVGDYQRQLFLMDRSEEHTSELQSRGHLVCRLLLEKKKGPIKDWGLEIERNSIVVNQKMETNIEGIYAVGDINIFPGKVKLIATGFGEGPTAINNAMQYLDPTARIQPRHSTNMF